MCTVAQCGPLGNSTGQSTSDMRSEFPFYKIQHTIIDVIILHLRQTFMRRWMTMNTARPARFMSVELY